MSGWVRHGNFPKFTLPRKVIIQRTDVRVPVTLSLLLKPEIQERIRKEHSESEKIFSAIISRRAN